MKKVHIVNSDHGQHPLLVKVYDRCENNRNQPEKDLLVATFDISKPEDFAQVVVHPGRYVVVEER